jgi:hypothetical protein
MRVHHITYLLLVAACFFSCSKELDLPDANSKKKIVLLGEFVAGEPMSFRAGQTVPVSSGSSLKFEVLKDLSVGIGDQLGNNFTVNGIADSLTQLLYTIPYSSAETAKPGNTYTITATHATLGTATTTVTIPGAFTASIKDTSRMVLGEDTVLAIDVVINDPADENYYVIEAVKQQLAISHFFYHQGTWLDMVANQGIYDSLKNKGITVPEKYDTGFSKQFDRRMVYTNDRNTENLRDNNTFSSFKRLLISDYNFKGQAYTTTVYLSILNTGEPYKGRFLLQVKSVSKQYYNYLKKYELSAAGSGYSSFAPPADIPNNVENGFGVVGGVYKQQFPIILDSWEP